MGDDRETPKHVLVASPKTRTWWKEGPVYQIWPASYKDSNGDGMGDIGGIISTLSYLASLGIKVIWVCPIYDSPQLDMGYDIRDYENIYAPYGSVEDVETLLHESHKLGLRVIFDLVINHTSDQHVWFQESRASKNSPKRDWYYWRPAKYSADGTRIPPNNWRSFFSESAWEWDETTQEYYLHLFAVEQPDLNWETAAARQAVYTSAMRFWLDKGVDGFRIDTCNMYSKPIDFPDAPVTDPLTPQFQRAHSLFCNGPRIHEFLSEMHEQVFAHYDCMTVGELPFTPSQQKVLQYVDEASKQLNMVFNFEIVDLGQGPGFKFEMVPYGLPSVKRALASWQNFVTLSPSAWTTVFMENHDQPRSINRYFRTEPRPDLSDPATHKACGKLLALLLATLTGTLFIYQGQEIGMVDIPDGSGPEEAFPLSDYQDVEVRNYMAIVAARAYESASAKEAAMAAALKGVQAMARDHARTPVQWSAKENAGFSAPGAKPWMRVNPSYARGINVAAQEADADSILHFWRRIVGLRGGEWKAEFIYGTFGLLDEENEDVFAYTKRSDEGREVLVVLNFTGERKEIDFEGLVGKKGLKFVVGNHEVGEESVLEAYEGRVYELL